MKIIALDANALTFDGLSWEPLEKLGDFKAYSTSTPEEGQERAKDVDAIIVNKFLVTKELISQCPKLKYVGITATGTNNVDLKFCAEKGIVVSNVPEYSTLSVAQLVFSYICYHYSRLADYSKLSNEWPNSKNFCMPLPFHRELSALTLCIVGFGAIGKKVAKIAEAFEMQIIVPAMPGRNYNEKRLNIEECFRKADIISLHCPLTQESDKLINSKTLASMKASAILINTSRGGLVDEHSLAEAINNKKISAAYLDVVSKEPPSPENPLFGAKNIFITPHIAWASLEARVRLLEQTAQNLSFFISGK